MIFRVDVYVNGINIETYNGSDAGSTTAFEDDLKKSINNTIMSKIMNYKKKSFPIEMILTYTEGSKYNDKCPICLNDCNQAVYACLHSIHYLCNKDIFPQRCPICREDTYNVSRRSKIERKRIKIDDFTDYRQILDELKFEAKELWNQFHKEHGNH